MIDGAKVLALRDGTIDMHGKPSVRAWTRLATTVVSGANQITLQRSVDWPVGSRIVIATTGNYLSQGQTEVKTITAVSIDGCMLTLDAPLNFEHLGVTRIVNSVPLEIRAEVGLLSHNVIFQGKRSERDTTIYWSAMLGSTTPSWNRTIEACPTGFNPGEFSTQTCFLGRYGQEMGSDQFGATIMISTGDEAFNATQRVVLRLSNIEVKISSLLARSISYTQ
jgi:hypothetical protein